MIWSRFEGIFKLQALLEAAESIYIPCASPSWTSLCCAMGSANAAGIVLLNAAFHAVVTVAGAVLMLLALIQLRGARRRRGGPVPLGVLLSVGVALLMLAFPPAPSATAPSCGSGTGT